jgi:hypothetical protein
VSELKKNNIELKREEILAAWNNLKNTGYRADLIVRDAGHKGLGVFSLRTFQPGEVVEYCHAIPFTSTRQNKKNDVNISKYSYWYGSCQCERCLKDGPMAIMPLGFGAIINSTKTLEESNVVFSTISLNPALVIFMARKPIALNEEIACFHGESYYTSWCERKPTQAAVTTDQNKKTQIKNRLTSIVA